MLLTIKKIISPSVIQNQMERSNSKGLQTLIIDYAKWLKWWLQMTGYDVQFLTLFRLLIKLRAVIRIWNYKSIAHLQVDTNLTNFQTPNSELLVKVNFNNYIQRLNENWKTAD